MLFSVFDKDFSMASKIARMLIDSNAPVNAFNQGHLTPLHIALKTGKR
jgi:hypothetical protein